MEKALLSGVCEEELQTRLENFEQLCRARGLRVTNQRREIFRAVAASRAHPSAECVLSSVRGKLPNISLDTVYRTLTSMERMSAVTRVGLLSKARFDAAPHPHFHFVCMECEQVYDIEPQGGASLQVPAYVKDFGDVKHVNLQFRGICNTCRAKKRLAR